MNDKKHFHRHPPSLWEPNCFFITPLGAGDRRKRADAVYETIDRSTREFGFRCWRDVDIFTSKPFMETIRRGLERSNFVIADVTDGRNNCYYELGIADGLARPVLLIAQTGTQQPPDVAGRQWLFYDDLPSLGVSIKNWIYDTVLFSDSLPAEDDSRRAKFGKRCFRDGYLLSAFLTSDGDRELDRVWYNLHASVRAVGETGKVREKVTFLLDKTFGENKRITVEPKRGIASFEIPCYGAFTLAAVIKEKKISLELDLSNIPGSNPTFRYE